MTRTAQEMDDEAARWVARMDAERWTDGEERALQRWLDGDPKRAGALLQAQAAWATLDAVARGGLAPAESTAPAPARPATRFSRRGALALGGAGAMAASYAGGLLLLGRAVRYRTELGEIRRVPLSDGSTASINTASSLAVAFEETRRSIRLDRGEAWFQVAHDAARPFVVAAGPVQVRAVGTAFAVRLREGGADIFVTEGIVEAWTGDGRDARRSARIAAGGHALFAGEAIVARTQAAEGTIDRALAWREGKIDLSGATLGEAAAEFNRYNRRRLVIADPAIAGERFDGIFSIDDAQGFAVAIQKSLDIPVDLAGPDEIRIGGGSA